MSASTSHDKCEPNLTPLLDLVLQLIMFFMVCANFVMEQTNESVKLPTSFSAKPLQKDQERYIFINMTVNEKKNDNGVSSYSPGVITYTAGVTTTVCNTVKVLEDELDRRIKADKDIAKRKGLTDAEWEKGKGRSLVILRADARLEFKTIAEVFATAKAVGYMDIQLRGTTKQDQ
jgi:biopolymer transport protein ExbD